MQGQLRLSTGEAELATISGASSGSVAVHEVPETFGDVFFRQPFHFVGSTLHHFVVAIRSNELHRAGAVLTHVREQGEGIAGRDVELSRPSSQDVGVFREKPLQEGAHDGVAMLAPAEGHGQRDGKRIFALLPGTLVGEHQGARRLLRETSHELAVRYEPELTHGACPLDGAGPVLG